MKDNTSRERFPSESDQINADPIDRFWDRYIELLKQQAVNPKNHRWYVRQAEQYIRAHPDDRLINHQSINVTHYLETLG